MRRNVTPVIAVLLAVFLASVAYVGAYSALVAPGLVEVVIHREFTESGGVSQTSLETHYKAGAHRVAWVFWPLEQIDRKIRPDQWTN